MIAGLPEPKIFGAANTGSYIKIPFQKPAAARDSIMGGDVWTRVRTYLRTRVGSPRIPCTFDVHAVWRAVQQQPAQPALLDMTSCTPTASHSKLLKQTKKVPWGR